jgi:hypothetical protein
MCYSGQDFRVETLCPKAFQVYGGLAAIDNRLFLSLEGTDLHPKLEKVAFDPHTWLDRLRY